MSGHTKWSQIKERDAADAEYQTLVAEEKRGLALAIELGKVRQLLGLTQGEIAQGLGVTQANVSKIEHARDPHLTTIRRYIESMGGTLHVIAEFPEGVSIDLLPLVAAEGAQRSHIDPD